MKTLLILSVSFLAIPFSSCKKDRTCICTTTVGGSADPTVTVVYKKISKRSAKAACLSTAITPSGSPEEIKTCTLK